MLGILLSRGNLVSSRVSVPLASVSKTLGVRVWIFYSLLQAFLQLNGRLTYGTALVGLRRSHAYQFRDRSVASVLMVKNIVSLFWKGAV